MTDKIYYKVQYPMKKAINILKDIEPTNSEEYDLSPDDIEKIQRFLDKWDNKSKSELKRLISNLKRG